MIKNELIESVKVQLPKLSKKQLSEILTLAEGWANGIAMVDLRVEPKSVSQLYYELKQEREKNRLLQDENAELHGKIEDYQECSQHLGDSFKRVMNENRWLRSDRYLKPREAQKCS